MTQEDSQAFDPLAVVAHDKVPWYKKKHLLKLNLIISCLLLLASANGYDGSMMNGLQSLHQWQDFMDHPTGPWLGLINGLYGIGASAALLLVAWVTQHHGRRVAVWIGIACVAIATVLGTGAQNVGMFMAARFFVGLASAWWGGSVPLLVTETAFPTHRGTVTALYNCGWYVGSLLAAWVTYGTRDIASSWAWRIPSVFQFLIPIVGCVGLLLVPESPRYLVSQNRNEQAKAVLVKWHGGGVANDLVDFEMEEITTAIRLEKEASATSYATMIATKGNLHRLFITVTLGTFAQFNGVNIVSYYLALVLETVGITSVRDQTLINGCLQIWNLILAVGAAMSVDRFGRRKLFMTSSVGMLIFFTIVTALSGSFAETNRAATGLAVIPFLFLYYGCYDLAFTPLLISYTCEIWPYALRSKGLAVGQICTNISVTINVFINPIALDAIGWKYYIVYVVILIIISLTCYLFYPETRNHSLEEMTVVFDGPSALTVSTNKQVTTVYHHEKV
ncbi:general substrate transporter [Lipomyces doorenjongii]